MGSETLSSQPLAVHLNHVENLLKCGFSFRGSGVGSDSAFPTSSQVRLPLLLGCGPFFE